MDEKTRTELEASAFRGLVGWLQKRTRLRHALRGVEGQIPDRGLAREGEAVQPRDR